MRANALVISTPRAEIILPAEMATAKCCQVQTKTGARRCGSTGLMAVNALIDDQICHRDP
jgi:hypothetical protein